MSLKNNFILFAFLIAFNISNSQNKEAPKINDDYPNIVCGKKNPKKDTDCTKYGTDSGMLCCYVTKSNEDPFCTLLSSKKADEISLKDVQVFDNNERWSCGNKSFYIKINIILIFILIFLI